MKTVHALLAVDSIAPNRTTNDYDTSALMITFANGHTSCARALVACPGIVINPKSPRFANDTAFNDACNGLEGTTRVVMVGLLLLVDGCHFRRNTDGDTPPDVAEGDAGIVNVFASAVDYWQRRRNGGHSWVMQEAVWTLLLVRQRLGALAPATGGSTAPALLPDAIRLAACAFLRSADFMPKR